MIFNDELKKLILRMPWKTILAELENVPHVRVNDCEYSYFPSSRLEDRWIMIEVDEEVPVDFAGLLYVKPDWIREHLDGSKSNTT